MYSYHIYSGFLSGLRSRGFSFSHRGGFPRKKLCVSFSYRNFDILPSSKYFPHRFAQGQGNTTISISAAPCDFPQQSGIRASGFRALVLITLGCYLLV